AGGDVHGLEIDVPGATASCAVVVIGHHVALAGLSQPPYGGAGDVVAHCPGEGALLPHAAQSALVEAVGEPAGGGVRIVAHEGHGPGIGIPVVQGHDPPLLVHKEKLVEGVAHIAVAGVHHVIVGVGDLHAGLVHGHGQVGLVVEAVVAGVHLVAGADV